MINCTNYLVKIVYLDLYDIESKKIIIILLFKLSKIFFKS